MRLLLMPLLLLLLVSGGKPLVQVTAIKGQVRLRDSQSFLKRADNIYVGSELVFGSPDAKIRVVDAGRNPCMFEGRTAERKGKLLIFKVGTSCPNLPSYQQHISKGGHLMNLSEIKDYFSTADDSRQPFLVIGQDKVYISPRDFRQDTERFFYVKFSHKGQVFNQPLPFSRDTLILDSRMFRADDTPVPASEVTDMELRYRDSSNYTVIAAPFTPLIITENEAVEQIKVIIGAMQNKPGNEIYQEVLSVFDQFYGKPDPTRLKLLLIKQGIKVD